MALGTKLVALVVMLARCCTIAAACFISFISDHSLLTPQQGLLQELLQERRFVSVAHAPLWHRSRGHSICHHVINSQSRVGDAPLLSVLAAECTSCLSMVSEKAGQEPRPNGLDTPSHKWCLGMLYYSQSIHDKGRNPVRSRFVRAEYCLEGLNVYHNRASAQVCAGIRSKHLTSSDLAQLPPESIPAGEFKACTALKHV